MGAWAASSPTIRVGPTPPVSNMARIIGPPGYAVKESGRPGAGSKFDTPPPAGVQYDLRVNGNTETNRSV
jgi:hypothetical protein